MKRAAKIIRFLVVLAVTLGIASTEPLLHHWLLHHPPPGAVSTGMHTGDSGHHLLCMRSFGNGFDSPYATGKGGAPRHAIAYFATPFFLLYGLVGEIGRGLGINEFLFLGWINGLGGALYMWMVYRFFREAAPKQALGAFLIFACGGGIGGVLFFAAHFSGLDSAAGFEGAFERFAKYELIEGQRLTPILLLPRLYYTLPLAMGFAALTTLLHADRRGFLRRNGRPRIIPFAFTGFLFFLATTINVRVGAMLWGVALIYLATASQRPKWKRAILALLFGVPAVLGGAMFYLITSMHPHYLANVSQAARECILLISFMTATLPLWPLLVPGAWRALGGLNPRARIAACALAGYIVAYGAGYFACQAYYGNWWQGGDASAAKAVSDYASAGLPLGALAALLFGRWLLPPLRSRERGDWTVLWFLAFLVAGLSAWSHPWTGEEGWYLQFTPQRLLVLLGPPMSLLVARELGRIRWYGAALAYAGLLAFGAATLAASTLYFQGPQDRTPGQGAFAFLQYGLMTPDDATLLDALPPGRVIVPGWSPIAFGEIVALRPGMRLIGGPGAMNLGDQDFDSLQATADSFFALDTTAAERREIVRSWGLEHVYCPDMCPVRPELMRELRKSNWLKETATAGRGAVFTVVME